MFLSHHNDFKYREIIMKSIVNACMMAALAAFLCMPFDAMARLHQDTVKDARGNLVTDSSGGCVRTMWISDSSADCAPAANRVRSVYFEFNRSSLTHEARTTLDEIVAYLKDPANKVRSINIVGYADTIGRNSYNQRLSEKRARRVQRYIGMKGFDKPNTLEVRGLGEDHASENKCEELTGRKKIECLWEERRVDIELNM
jgi:outer membrane protein OmpA-like peptidoglycan-associated protein